MEKEMVNMEFYRLSHQFAILHLINTLQPEKSKYLEGRILCLIAIMWESEDKMTVLLSYNWK